MSKALLDECSSLGLRDTRNDQAKSLCHVASQELLPIAVANLSKENCDTRAYRTRLGLGLG